MCVGSLNIQLLAVSPEAVPGVFYFKKLSKTKSGDEPL
jgi:hypothetical protein